MRVTLFWTVSEIPEHDYTVFVHLYDAHAQLIASHDGPPLFGYLPTSQWPPGRIVPDRHDFALPETLPPGEYRLAAGLYDPTTGQRLSLLGEKGIVVGDHVELDKLILP